MSLSSIHRRARRTFRRMLGLGVVRGMVRAEILGVSETLDADIVGLEAAALSLRRSSHGVVFDIPDDAAPTVPLFSPRPRSGDLIDLVDVKLIRVSAHHDAATSGRTALLFEPKAEGGEALARVSMALSHPRRDWFVVVPAGCVSAALKLRFAGQGGLGPLALAIVADDASARVDLEALDLSADGDGEVDISARVNARVRTLFKARRYDAIRHLQRHPVMQSDLVNRLTLASLIEQREFDLALDFYARWATSAELRADWEAYALTALANLGRWDAVNAAISQRLDRQEAADLDALARAFPFTAPNRELRGRVIDRLAAAKEWRPAMLDAANRSLFLDQNTSRDRLVSRALVEPAVDPADRHLLASQVAFRAGDPEAQRAEVNAALATWSLAPVSGDPSRALAVGEMTGAAGLTKRMQGPGVSVVMTTFNSAATVGYAIRSLLAQTHAALEIVVIDDASTDGTVDIVRDMAARDGRIRVWPQSVNAGTYVCRNHGLAQATGRFVLNQDSDDWAHPEKIARLVSGIEEAGTVAVFAQALRLSSDEGFQCRGGFVRPDGTSLMFERESVLARMAGYEAVRAGADGEFHRRMEGVFGVGQIHEMPLPLSVVAVRAQSLSRAAAHRIDEETGVFTPERNAYRRNYLRRHAVIFQAESGVGRDGDSSGES